MSDAAVHAVLDQIRTIAEKAAETSGLPPAVAQALADIQTLAATRVEGSRETSDMPATENQSL